MNNLLTIRIESTWEAEQVVDALIELERRLRDNLAGRGHLRLANRIHLARRKLQEEAGLVIGLKRLNDLATGRVKGMTEAQFRRELRKRSRR